MSKIAVVYWSGTGNTEEMMPLRLTAHLWAFYRWLVESNFKLCDY